MAELTCNRWHWTKGCREWMDKTPFAGVPFTKIFYDGMRTLFADQKNRPGLLYQGLVWPASEKVVAANGGKRYRFTQGDQLRFLRRGNFKYADNREAGTLPPSLLAPLSRGHPHRRRRRAPQSGAGQQPDK